MSKQYCIFCIIIIEYLNLLNAASIPLRSFISSTYKPSILQLPPGFDSQKPPYKPMLYPFAVPSSIPSTRPTLKINPSTTAGWIPVALSGQKEIPLIPNTFPTTKTLNLRPLAVLEDRISHDEPKYSSPSYNDGPVFESIVYGTWKPDPPLQPVGMLNNTKHEQQDSSSSISGLVADGKAYNKTINRQHGGFIGQIQQKPTKVDRQILQKYTNEKISSTYSSADYKFKQSTAFSFEQKQQNKVKKQGRQKIRQITNTTEQSVIERSSNSDETTTTTTKENIQHQHQIRVIKVNATDPKLMEVVKQINESVETKYNHKQTSPHSIDMMTTAEPNDELVNDELEATSLEFMSTEPQLHYEDDNVDILEKFSATRRSWPIDFMDEEPLATTATNNDQPNESDFVGALGNDSKETDSSEIPSVLSALNIPPSLWPNLPGNITKLGKPFETKSSAEESALCVPITVREQNMVNSKELVYIERIFCFPMPPSTTISEIGLATLGSSITSSSTTFRTVTKAKVRNFDDFIDTHSRVANLSYSNFKSQLYLITSTLVIYFKFIA